MTTCVCLSPALITNAYTFVSVQTAAALDTKPGVCRNCQGIGAVLCKLHFFPFCCYYALVSKTNMKFYMLYMISLFRVR